MKKLFTCMLLLSSCILDAAGSQPAAFIVRDGQPNAQIIITAGKRPRMTTLAALELQSCIRKISGASLQVVTSPDSGTSIKIYVGKSAWTDKLGVTDEGLRDGAFRAASGSGWLVLLGRDYDFDPPFKPWPMSRKDVKAPLAKWEEVTRNRTDGGWGFPFAAGFKGYWNPNDFDKIMSGHYGEGFSALWKTAEGSQGGFWNEDEGGSLNAVYDFLNCLGVRWYMPGEIGEVIPKLTSIPMPDVNKTVKPDYAVRSWLWYNYSGFCFDDVIWARRIGMNSGYGKLGPMKGPHGLVNVLEHETMRKKHPEYYALIGGKRDTEHRDRGTPCLTSEGLFKETVNYVRFFFDEYNLPSVDIWPVDGLRLCQCESCKGKSAPELVWGFANRVAAEVCKTHPDRLITCGAYTSYVDPPDSIRKFSPNLAVAIANSGRPLMDDPEHWATYWNRVEQWRNRLAPGRILRYENNRYSLWGDGGLLSFPIIHPRTMAKDLKALKGISFGDRCEESQKGAAWHAPGIDHVTLYVQARFLWDAGQDVEKLLDEYFTLFYGPAAAQMKEAINFAERTYNRKDRSRSRGRADPRNVPLEDSLRFRDLLDKARDVAGETVYGLRIRKLISELKPRVEIIAESKKKVDPKGKAADTDPDPAER
jgi:hypothetical protein